MNESTNDSWILPLRKSVTIVDMRPEFRSLLRQELLETWTPPGSARPQHRSWAVASAAVLIVGLVAALIVERSRDDEASVADPSNPTMQESVSSVGSSLSPTSATIIESSSPPESTAAPTASSSPTSENGTPMTTIPDGTTRPVDAVTVEQLELPSSAMFQATVSADDRVITLKVIGMRTYDPTNPCTRYYEVNFTESAERVTVEVVAYRPPGDPPQGCRAIGERREFIVSLSEPLDGREVVFQGQAIDLPG